MNRMTKTIVIAALAACWLGTALYADTVPEFSHSFLQANDADGVPLYDADGKVSVTGIILNNPEHMLDPTAGPAGIGGQWQIFVQSAEPNDTAATAVWMGQNYSSVFHMFGDYDDEKFARQLCDMNFDPATGYRFNAGDKVKITGYYKAYGGKLNINESHQVDDAYDVVIDLLEPAHGLPQPEVITLDSVKTGFGHTDFAFYGADRTRGCERYQSRLVRVNNVTIVDPENWRPNSFIRIEDAAGYTFDVKLGIGSGFSIFDAPTGPIDVIGIFNQEAPGCSICDYGYMIWVTNYDGNGLVLTDRGQQRGNLPGDVNFDAKVDLADFAIIAGYWLDSVTGLHDCSGVE